MKVYNFLCLWRAFIDFYGFLPKQQTFLLFLMVIQGITAGVGLLLIIPLLQLIGLDTGPQINDQVSGLANDIYSWLGIHPNLATILLSYIAIVTIIATLRYQLLVRSVSVQQHYISHLRHKLFHSLLYCRWQFISQNKTSEFFHGLTGQIQTIGVASLLMLTSLSQLIIAVIMLVLSLFISWHITLFAILFLSLLIIVISPFNRKVYRSGNTQLISYKSLFQQLSEQLSSLKMIKSFTGESHYIDQLNLVSQQLEQQHIQLTRANAVTQWIYIVGTVVALSLFFYVSLVFFDISLASNLLLLIIFARQLPQISSLQKNYQQLLHKIPAINDVERLYKSSFQERESIEQLDSSPTFNQYIKLANVSYCYPEKKQPVFEDLSLQINKNETVAIIGDTGVGKSTLTDLIAGLIEPTSGEIFCDTIALSDANRLAWRQQVAYVTQDVFLFNDTIRANMTWVVDKEISDNELWQALEKAEAKDFVTRLPNQLGSIVGDRGVRLSGGEKQRLAIARALLLNPQLLILDEATNALDYESEKRVQNSLRRLKGKITLVIISHNTSAIEDVDYRINLNTKNKTARQNENLCSNKNDET